MENIKLTYFIQNGRVGLIRAMLCYKKVPFENIMLSLEDWKTKKTNYEFHQLPELEVNGKKMTQTIAICLYLARQLNLYPKDYYLQYHVDSLLAVRDDITPLYRKLKYKFNTEEDTKAYKAQMILYLKNIEKRYNELGSGKYYVGDELTVADFFLGCMITEFCCLVKDEDVMSKYAPGIKKLIDRLNENELKEYLEKYFIPLEKSDLDIKIK